MSSRKSQGAVERLPADFEEPRQQHQMSPASKLGADLGPLLHTSPETKFDAIRVVTFDHHRTPETPETIARAGVVLAALGLLDAPARPVTVSASSVPCPQCKAAIGCPCVSAKSGNAFNGWHRGRSRRAQELREAAA